MTNQQRFFLALSYMDYFFNQKHMKEQGPSITDQKHFYKTLQAILYHGS